ncbi:MAG: pirin family protein, partial [Cyclobacteriaceae bacterium]|nr:pirin family protein [Cyclobacteriaceae bacterium]
HSRHTFSFGHYYNPERIHFGALRVLNDDIVEPGMGFGTHPHDNMEIVSIPLEGALAHKDSTGHEAVIRTGDVQIMSAGSGLTHSEYNHSKADRVCFLQIWVLPQLANITPRYEQKSFGLEGRKNKLQTVVAPDDAQALWINQQAWFHLVHLDSSRQLTYTLRVIGHGLYAFVIRGRALVNDIELGPRDGLGIYETESLDIKATQEVELLLIEVPMRI